MYRTRIEDVKGEVCRCKRGRGRCHQEVVGSKLKAGNPVADVILGSHVTYLQ